MRNTMVCHNLEQQKEIILIDTKLYTIRFHFPLALQTNTVDY